MDEKFFFNFIKDYAKQIKVIKLCNTEKLQKKERKRPLAYFKIIPVGVKASGNVTFLKMTSLLKAWHPLTELSELLPTIGNARSQRYTII